jgi:hypothetical protein
MKDSNGLRIVITHVQPYRIAPKALFLHKKATRKNYNLLFLLVVDAVWSQPFLAVISLH